MTIHLTVPEIIEVTTTLEQDVQTAEASFAKPNQDVAVVEESRALSPVDQVMGMIAAASRDPTVDVAKMRELLGLQKDFMAMQAEQQFTEAFHRMQTDMPRVKRNGAVEYKGKEAFKFATWEAIDAVLRPILHSEGFALSFDSAPRQGDGGGLIVTATLSHIGGAKRTASIPVPLDTSGGKNNIQGYGSAMAYGKRYTTTSLCNIITEADDDDGKRGGMEFITPDQVLEIQELALATNTEEGRFLEMMTSEARSFEEIEVKDFARLTNALISKRRQMAARRPTETQT